MTLDLAETIWYVITLGFLVSFCFIYFNNKIVKGWYLFAIFSTGF